MRDVVLVKILHCEKDLIEDEFSFNFRKGALFNDLDKGRKCVRDRYM